MQKASIKTKLVMLAIYCITVGLYAFSACFFDFISTVNAKSPGNKHLCKDSIIKRHKILTSGPLIPSTGTSTPAITVIIYIDTLCPSCYKTVHNLEAIANSYKGIKIIYKELPIHGRLSIDCACLALVAHTQGKYRIFKQCAEKYFKEAERKPNTIPNCWTPANQAGLNIKNAHKAINNIEIIKTLRLNFDEAKNIIPDIDTPIIIVGNTVIKGYIPKNRLDLIIRTELKKTN